MEDLKILFKAKKEHPQSIALSPLMIKALSSEALNIVMPGMIHKAFDNIEQFANYIEMHLENWQQVLKSLNLSANEIKIFLSEYRANLFSIAKNIEGDANMLLAGDPAAKNIEEVVLCYPGLYAIGIYRLAHFIYKKNIVIVARMFSELAHTRTGIDIHPGAEIGHSFFIDHGTGVVIGETSIIGNRVKIYQGVTLGALSVDKTLQNQKRHPTILDDCVIYAHATILGGETIIGAGSVIGGNVWLTKSIPSHSIVYHQSVVKLDKMKGFNQDEEIIYEI